MIREPPGQLHGEMELTLARSDRSVEGRGPAGDVVEVCLELPRLARRGLGAVHRDLEGVLGNQHRQGTYHSQHEHGHKNSHTGVYAGCILVLKVSYLV